MNEPETFHSKWLGLFRETRKRGAEVGFPAHASGFSRIIPSSDIDTNPIGSKREALEQYNGWVFGAASFIAEEMRALEWNIWLKTRVRREEWEIDARHEFNDVLAQPNASQTWGDFVELTDLHFSISGEFYWHVITTPTGRAIGLEVIYPHWVREPVIESGKLTGWRVAKPGSAPRVIPAGDVIRVHRPHPLSPFQAASIVEAVAVSHYFDLYARAYGMTMLRNDAGIPAGLLSSEEQLTADQADAIREGWRQRYSQSKGEIAVTGHGAKFQPIGIPLGDLKLLEIGELTRDQVLSMFRVAPALLGITTDSNRANMEAALWGFQRHTLRPRASRVAETIRVRVMPRFIGAAEARRRYFEFRDVVDKDHERERATANDMLRNGGITINEYRERMGSSPLEGHGDVFMVPSGFTLREQLEESEPLALPAPAEDEDAEDERSLLALPSRLAALKATEENQRLANENRKLRVGIAERKHYNNLRGYFAKSYQVIKKEHEFATNGQPVALIHNAAELHDMGVTLPDERLLWRDESLVEYFERLKGPVAKQLAREMAEKEVTA